MEELLTGELAGNEDEVTARVGALLLQLQMGRDHGQVLEMARTALRSWGLAEIEAIKPYLVPELAVWPSAEDAAVIHKAQGVDERSVERAEDTRAAATRRCGRRPNRSRKCLCPGSGRMIPRAPQSRKRPAGLSDDEAALSSILASARATSSFTTNLRRLNHVQGR